MKDIKKGKILLLIILILIVAWGFIGILNVIVSPSKVITWILRFSASVILSYLVYKGNNSARKVVGVLLIIGSIITLAGSKLFSFSSFLYYFSIVHSIVFGAMGIILLSSKNITKFMEFQQAENEKGKSATKKKSKKESHWDKQWKR